MTAERSNDGLIKQAIESAKCRIYKINYVMDGNISSLHQKKAENQKELMEITVKALERYGALERVIERLEKEKSNLTTWAEDEAYKLAINKSIEIIKQELM